jgi:hypothetical protein
MGTVGSTRALDRLFDVRRPADQARARLAGLQVDVEAELAGDHDSVPEALRRLAQDALALVRPIYFGSVEEGDPGIMRRADDPDHLRAGGDRAVEGAAHILHAHADRGNLERAELSPIGRTRRRLRHLPHLCGRRC